jgi:hypothetical protein
LHKVKHRLIDPATAISIGGNGKLVLLGKFAAFQYGVANIFFAAQVTPTIRLAQKGLHAISRAPIKIVVRIIAIADFSRNSRTTKISKIRIRNFR